MEIPARMSGLVLAAFAVACATPQDAPPVAPQPAEEPALASDPGESTYHAMLGEMALQREMYETAVKEFRRAAELSTDPELIERATALAFAYEAYDDARVCAQRWIRLQPDAYAAHRYLALIELRTGNVDAALPHLTVLREAYGAHGANPDLALLAILGQEERPDTTVRAMRQLVDADETAEGRYAVGVLALRAGRVELAADSARRALALREDWPAAGMLLARALIADGKDEKGVAKGREIAGASEDPAVHLEFGALLSGLGHYDEARREFEIVLAEGSRATDAIRALALVAMQQRDLDTARRHFGVLVTSGYYDEAYYYLGRISRQEGLYDDALVYFESVEPSEYFLPAQIEIAGVQQDLGDLEAGRQHLRELAQAFPDYEIAALSADADLLVEAGRPEEALGIYDEAIAAHPDAIELRYSKAFLLEKQGRVDEAVEMLRAILAETPEDPIALNALGYTLADRTGELDEARRLIARALEADPLNAAIIDSMGWVLYKQGDTAGALHYLWRARILSRDPEIATHLGEVLWATGAADEARRIWDEALSEYPESEVLREVMERFGR